MSDSGRRAARCPPDRSRGVGNILSLQWPSSRHSSSNRASEVFCQHLTQRRHIHHRLRQKLLQARILLLQRLQPLGLRHLHAAILLAPGVKGRVGYPVFAAQLTGRHASLMLLQNADDLFLRKPGSLHCLSPSLRNRLTQNREHLRGAGQNA
nr:UDP-glucose pyrophosphorylase [uncultured bacterium]